MAVTEFINVETEVHREYGTENLNFIKGGKVIVWVSDYQLQLLSALHCLTACILVCGYWLLLITQLAK
jgi:hypothetical protein